MIELRQHQQNAINTTINNNFESGVHFHATGTGKSIIALNILEEYLKKYNQNSWIWWICEQKSILSKFFNEKTTINFLNKLTKNYNLKIIDLVKKSNSNFIQDINNIINDSNDNYLLISNRHYLTYNTRYTDLNKLPHLVIHDECHSIKNKSTYDLLNYLKQQCNELNQKISIIGFSATPEYSGPYNNILTEYSIYDAYCDNQILSPHIIWFETAKNINENVCELIKQLYYKKIIVWCGLIKYAEKLIEIFKLIYNDFIIALDTSTKQEYLNEFYEAESNAILFCASKHREGSDIKNLDCCIFMDLVAKRSSRTFIQCIGRVLRLDPNSNKKYGLIIDYKARSVGEIINRLSKYIHSNDFPYNYSINNLNKNYKYYQLNLIKAENKISKIQLNTNRDQIIRLFKRHIPECNEYSEYNEYSKYNEYSECNEYHKRLSLELNLIESKNLFSYLQQAVKILELTIDIPHVTRGSCGSSLVCYLLGISNVDPVKYNIKFSRFLNEYRNNLPDIDFDFPHCKRDEVFIRISKKWPNQIARISNHIHFHRKSAERDVLKTLGYRSFIDKYSVQKIINKFSISERARFDLKVKKLEGTFKCYSLHCGGIVFYPDGVPEEFILKSGLIDQVNFDKRFIAKEKNFKIDILSSKALSQLYTFDKTNIPKNSYTSFDNIQVRSEVFDIFKRGDNIGITLAESPLIRKTFLMFKPNTIEDLAVCLSVIRPIAKESRKEGKITGIIYDDDAIDLIKNYFNVSEDYADKLRRELSKNNFDILKEFNDKKYKYLPEDLKNLSEYSFCKAHAMSYAQLIYRLVELKYDNPSEFWRCALLNCSSSYKKWVHPYEAYKVGVEYSDTVEKSIYCNKQKLNINLDHKIDKILNDSYFIKKINKSDNIYIFSGLIAHIRVLSITSKEKNIVTLIGTKSGYFEIITKGNFYFSPKAEILTGKAKLECEITQSYRAKSFKYICIN